MRRFRVAVLAPVLVVVAAGCGSGSSSNKSTSSAAATPPTTVSSAKGNAIAVGETEYKLTPANPSVKSGTVVIAAKNNGAVTHAIEVEGGASGGGNARSANIAPGQTTTLTVQLKPGKTYTWFCPIDGHRGLGMKGAITVSGAGATTSGSAGQTTTGGASPSSSGGSSGGSSRGAY